MSTDPSFSPVAPPKQPGKVQAIAIMTLVGGVIGCIAGVGFLGVSPFLLCLTVPFGAYSLTMGIMCVIKGSKLLGQNSFMEAPPKTTAIMQIVNIICGDITNLALGIVILVFLSDPEVAAYYRGQ